jgi:integrase
MNKKNHRSFGYIRKLPSKAYQASYVGPDGKRYYAPRPFVAKSDADGFLALEQTSINQGKWVRPAERNIYQTEALPSQQTLRSVFPRFVSLRTTRTGEPLRRTTKDLYNRLMFSTMRDWLDTPLGEISKESFAEWYMGLQAKGKKTTASKCYSLIRSVLSWAVEEGYILSNPVQIKGGYTSKTGRETQLLDGEQIQELALAIEPELEFAVLLSAYGGLRFSEIAGLQRKDIEILSSAQGVPEGLSVTVARGAVKVRKDLLEETTNKFSVELGPTKSRKSNRQVSVHEGLVRVAQSHLEKFVGKHPSSQVFGVGTNRNELVPYDFFEHRYSKAKRAIGCGAVSSPIHSLRKFGATSYANAGANLSELSDWLGDSSTEAIMRYVKSTGRARNLANSMEFPKK